MASAVLTYFTEKVNTLHYLALIGDNESGKTQFLFCLTLLAYRGFYGSDINTANLIEFLGCDDGIVRGSIFEDECEDLVQDADKRRLYKCGYKKGAKIPRVLIHKERGLRIQKFYNAYCFKAIAAEELPYGRNAKGVLERFIILKMIEGSPLKDSISDEDLAEADDLRTQLLALRLFYWTSELPKVDLTIQVGSETVVLKGRQKELFECVLRIGALVDALEEAKKAVAFFLKKKVEERQSSLEGIIAKALYELVKERLPNLNEYVEVEFEAIFEKIRELSNGVIDDNKILSDDFDFPISKQLIGRRLSDAFQAEIKNVENKRMRVFKRDVLLKLLRKYRILKLDSDFQEKCDSTLFQQYRFTDLPISAVVRGGEVYGYTEKKGDAGGLPNDGKIYSKMSIDKSSSTPDISKSVYQYQVDSKHDRKILPLHSFQKESRHFSKTSNISKDEAISKEEQISKPPRAPSTLKVLGDPLEGFKCLNCGGQAYKVVEVDGSRKALCLKCIINFLPLDELIRTARRCFEKLSVEGLALEEDFKRMLETETPLASTLLEYLIKNGKIIRVRDGWLKWA
ncbi:MAG: hypothetical protein QXG12_04705 [Thermoproteota archaeon]